MLTQAGLTPKDVTQGVSPIIATDLLQKWFEAILVGIGCDVMLGANLKTVEEAPRYVIAPVK